MSKSEVLTNKRVILNAPGNLVSDVYYRDADTRVDQIESLSIMGRFSQSLILNWGSTSNIQIPNSGNILHQVFLYMRVPQIQANEFINRGFLYNAIDSITWTLGSSTQSQLRYDQKTIFQTAMSMMTTEEARSLNLVVAGESHISATTNTPDATIILPLPWSSLRCDMDCTKKGIDTSLLTTNINLQITLATANKIYGGTDTHPSGPLECYVFTREEVLSNKANSIRDELFSGNLMYSYPFIHRQSPTPKNILTNVEQTINLAEFLESDLQAITFSAHLVVDQDNTGNLAPNVLFPLEVCDIELLYNGQTIWKAPGRTARLIPTLYDGGSSSVKCNRIEKLAVPTVVAADAYVYYIPFASMFKKNIVYACEYSNSPRFANQTIQLKMNVSNAPGAGPGTGAGSEPAVVYFTYYYSAVAEISGGVSTITFA